MKPTRHELLDMLAAMTDDELRRTISEARGIDPGPANVRDLIHRELNRDPEPGPATTQTPVALNDDEGLARIIGAAVARPTREL
ncbi:hypothetical protein RCF27_01265 [Rhodococcus pyridinivorans]|uniref:hypothetical protein n=1 Tax=Rhodococcus pyridinivorans TaxID=103816 RepID=UPI00280B2CE0|nr:hypothetical protein [Rhodococcus pyridinivorans]WMM73013.1 hypothetical protein RCF27_01265 [Rhodococcus pyridinivorans]